jgi:membrane-associated phospholipid phosphatase
LKLALALGLNLFAFVPYFWLQRHIFFPVTVMNKSALDVWLGFYPQAVWLYLSLFLLMPVAPMQMEKTQQLRRYALGVVAISLAADLVFFFWPTAVVRPGDAAASMIYRSLASLDLPLNAFPSLHAAMAVFSACCCEQIFSQVRYSRLCRIAVWIWALAIIGAMLSTKQHVAVDALGGIVLGLTSYYWAFRYLPLRRREIRFKTGTVKREGWTT